MNFKKNYLMLQMFAEDSGSGNGTDGATGSEENKGAADNGQQGGTGNGGSNQQKDAPKYTDADVNALLNKKFAEWKQKQEKETSEAEKLAKMSAEEKANKRLADVEKELQKFKEKEAKAEMASQARSILQDKNTAYRFALRCNSSRVSCRAFA